MYVYEHNNLALQKILSLSGFSCWCLEQLPVHEKQHGAVEQLDVEEQLAAAPWKLPGAAPISLGRVGSPTNSTSKEIENRSTSTMNSISNIFHILNKHILFVKIIFQSFYTTL